MTVLFADLAGFTAFAHGRDPEEVREQIQPLLARFDALIVAHGGATEKHIGDAIMAVFGAGQAREDDAAQAVRAALALQAALGDGPSAVVPPLRLRIGLHTGIVVVGAAPAPGELGLTGDTVNLASRLEGCAPAGGVLISHDTYRQVYGLFTVQALAPLQVAGVTEPVPAYLVLRAKPRAVATQLRGVEGVLTEMIGRAAELQRLQTAFHTVLEERHVQVITITGEAGIGKSCLLREFQKWIEPLPQIVRFFAGRATPEMPGRPFSLLRDVFCSRFEIQDSDSPAAAREKFEHGIVELLAGSGSAGGAADEGPAVQSHFIGQLLGLDFSASPHLHELLNDPDQIRRRAAHYLSRFFAGLSQGTSSAGGPPVSAALLVAEDVHWSDDESLDLINQFARTCQGAPLLIVCLARPTLYERRPAWGEGLPGHQRLALEPLSPRDSRVLVQAILRQASEVPQALRELIVGGAEGIPFFIEEIIKMLMDQQVIVPGPEHWRIEPQRLATVRVPATLTGVLQARLDGLTPDERRVIQMASVVGRVFWDRVVERLHRPLDGLVPAVAAAAGAEPGPPRILAALRGLRRKELIFQREASAFAGAVEYTFKHELLRNVAYESVLKKSRREFHAQIAGWLIEQSGERVGEFTDLVAAHFAEAGRPADAADWFGRAGQQARAAYAPATAAEQFRRAVAWLPAELKAQPAVQTKELEWQQGLGDALCAQARFTEAAEAFAAARTLAEQLGDLLAKAGAWNGLAFQHERLGNNRASVECAERAEALAGAVGAAGRRERIRALHLKGWACYRMGDAPAVLALAEQTQQLCTETGDRPGLATSFKLHGVAHLQLGHYADADRFFAQGRALFADFGDRRNTAAMWSNLGESARLRGDHAAAVGLYQQALAIAREIGHRESEIIYLINLSGARIGLRQFALAEADLREAIALGGTPLSGALSEASGLLSEALLGQGQQAEALDFARQALRLARQSENELDLGGAWRALGQVLAALEPNPPPVPEAVAGDGSPVVAAGACLAESLRVFERMNARGEQARTLRAWAECERQCGRIEESRAKLAAALGLFEQLGATSEVAATAALLAR